MSSLIQIRAFQESNARYNQVFRRALSRLSCWDSLFSLEKEERCIRIAQKAFRLRYQKLVRGQT